MSGWDLLGVIAFFVIFIAIIVFYKFGTVDDLDPIRVKVDQ